MILFRSLNIQYLDKLGRLCFKSMPFNSDARRVLADMYRNSNIVVIKVYGSDAEESD